VLVGIGVALAGIGMAVSVGLAVTVTVTVTVAVVIRGAILFIRLSGHAVIPHRVCVTRPILFDLVAIQVVAPEPARAQRSA
jgi:hypothetical protein